MRITPSLNNAGSRVHTPLPPQSGHTHQGASTIVMIHKHHNGRSQSTEGVIIR